MSSFCQNLEGRDPYFVVTTEYNRMGGFADVQIISWSLMILNYIHISSQFWNAESWIVIFGGQTVSIIHANECLFVF